MTAPKTPEGVEGRIRQRLSRPDAALIANPSLAELLREALVALSQPPPGTRAGGDTERERIRRFSDFVELSAGAGIVCHVGPLGAQLQMEWHGEQPLSDFMDQVLDAARRGEKG